MLNTSAESGTSRRSSTGGARRKSLKGGQGKPKAYKLGETQPMNVSGTLVKLTFDLRSVNLLRRYFDRIIVGYRMGSLRIDLEIRYGLIIALAVLSSQLIAWC